MSDYKWDINTGTIDGIHAEYTPEQRAAVAKMTPEERAEAKRELYEIFKRDAENDWCKTFQL